MHSPFVCFVTSTTAHRGVLPDAKGPNNNSAPAPAAASAVSLVVRAAATAANDRDRHEDGGGGWSIVGGAVPVSPVAAAAGTKVAPVPGFEPKPNAPDSLAEAWHHEWRSEEEHRVSERRARGKARDLKRTRRERAERLLKHTMAASAAADDAAARDATPSSGGVSERVAKAAVALRGAATTFSGQRHADSILRQRKRALGAKSERDAQLLAQALYLPRPGLSFAGNHAQRTHRFDTPNNPSYGVWKALHDDPAWRNAMHYREHNAAYKTPAAAQRIGGGGMTMPFRSARNLTRGQTLTYVRARNQLRDAGVPRELRDRLMALDDYAWWQSWRTAAHNTDVVTHIMRLAAWPQCAGTVLDLPLPPPESAAASTAAAAAVADNSSWESGAAAAAATAVDAAGASAGAAAGVTKTSASSGDPFASLYRPAELPTHAHSARDDIEYRIELSPDRDWLLLCRYINRYGTTAAECHVFYVASLGFDFGAYARAYFVPQRDGATQQFERVSMESVVKPDNLTPERIFVSHDVANTASRIKAREVATAAAQARAVAGANAADAKTRGGARAIGTPAASAADLTDPVLVLPFNADQDVAWHGAQDDSKRFVNDTLRLSSDAWSPAGGLVSAQGASDSDDEWLHVPPPLQVSAAAADSTVPPLPHTAVAATQGGGETKIIATSETAAAAAVAAMEAGVGQSKPKPTPAELAAAAKAKSRARRHATSAVAAQKSSPTKTAPPAAATTAEAPANAAAKKSPAAIQQPAATSATSLAADANTACVARAAAARTYIGEDDPSGTDESTESSSGDDQTAADGIELDPAAAAQRAIDEYDFTSYYDKLAERSYNLWHKWCARRDAREHVRAHALAVRASVLAGTHPPPPLSKADAEPRRAATDTSRSNSDSSESDTDDAATVRHLSWKAARAREDAHATRRRYRNTFVRHGALGTGWDPTNGGSGVGFAWPQHRATLVLTHYVFGGGDDSVDTHLHLERPVRVTAFYIRALCTFAFTARAHEFDDGVANAADVMDWSSRTEPVLARSGPLRGWPTSARDPRLMYVADILAYL